MERHLSELTENLPEEGPPKPLLLLVDDEKVGRMVAEKFIAAGFEHFAYAGLTGNLYTKLSPSFWS